MVTREERLLKAQYDLDATVIESSKREAYYTSLRERGYQQFVAYWAEHDLIVSDQLRDFNIPAGIDLLSLLKDVIGVLPRMVRLVRVGSNSALYVHMVCVYY